MDAPVIQNDREELRKASIHYFDQNRLDFEHFSPEGRFAKFPENINLLKDIGDLSKEYKYSDFHKQVTNDLTTRYDFYRRIRGDGNCYYRAVYVNYMEHLIVFENEPATCVLDLIIDIFDRKEFFFYEINSKFDLIYSRFVVGYLFQIYEVLRGDHTIFQSLKPNDDFQ